MMNFKDGKELSEYITKETGLKCFYKKRQEVTENHFIVDDINDTDFFADNNIHLYLTKIQISFFTKSPYQTRKYNKFIKGKFNASSSYSFESDNEWYQSIYETQVIYGDE